MAMDVHEATRWRQRISRVPDFPKPGVEFFDITPLLADAGALHAMVSFWAKRYEGGRITHVAGIESRGFILGAALAARLNVGFIPMRKPGKLPRKVERQDYALEYGKAQLQVHSDDLGAKDRVLVVDDVLATGGTMAAALALIARCGAQVHEATVLIEIAALQGRLRLCGAPLHSILTY